MSQENGTLKTKLDLDEEDLEKVSTKLSLGDAMHFFKDNGYLEKVWHTFMTMEPTFGKDGHIAIDLEDHLEERGLSIGPDTVYFTLCNFGRSFFDVSVGEVACALDRDWKELLREFAERILLIDPRSDMNTNSVYDLRKCFITDKYSSSQDIEFWNRFRRWVLIVSQCKTRGMYEYGFGLHDLFSDCIQEEENYLKEMDATNAHIIAALRATGMTNNEIAEAFILSLENYGSQYNDYFLPNHAEGFLQVGIEDDELKHRFNDVVSCVILSRLDYAVRHFSPEKRREKGEVHPLVKLHSFYVSPSIEEAQRISYEVSKIIILAAADGHDVNAFLSLFGGGGLFGIKDCWGAISMLRPGYFGRWIEEILSQETFTQKDLLRVARLARLVDLQINDVLPEYQEDLKFALRMFPQAHEVRQLV